MQIFENDLCIFTGDPISITSTAKHAYTVQIVWNDCPYDDPLDQRVPLTVVHKSLKLRLCHIEIINGSIAPVVIIKGIL